MKDAESLDAILGALYECVSGPAGQERDWDRMRSLFFPGGRLIRTSIGPDGAPRAQVMDVEAYRADTSPVFRREPFHEREIRHRAVRFGHIAHVLSTYEARRHPDDPAPFRRGINSVQLFHDGSRWWILSILWDNERPDNPLPEE